MLLGQKLKSRGWCEQKKKPVNPTDSDKTEENGYGKSSDTACPLCNFIFNPVCGINGVTYTNLCRLRECARLDLANKGPCGVPNFKAVDGAECKCNFQFNPVCGNDFVTYQDRCVMNCNSVSL